MEEILRINTELHNLTIVHSLNLFKGFWGIMHVEIIWNGAIEILLLKYFDVISM